MSMLARVIRSGAYVAPRLEARVDARPRTPARARVFTAMPLALALVISAGIFGRALQVWAPEGDSALHYKLMRDIARTGELPSDLPNYPARIADGGAIEAYFPYSYTPLFHLAGAFAVRVAGAPGVAAMNALAAGAAGLFVFIFVRRRAPALAAAAAAACALLPPTTLRLFTHVYMEPLMLALTLAGAWCLYVASVTRAVRPAMLSGLLLGLAVGVRQVALLYVAVLALTAMVSLVERRAWSRARRRREATWIAAGAATFIAVCLPFVAYLAYASGHLGYADIALFGEGRVPVDAGANAYIASITKPDLTVGEWLGRYRASVLYGERWLPSAYAAVPVAFFFVGAVYMNRRGGAARFYARFAALQVIAEALLFVVLHGNDRYVVASRFLFYSVVPIGAYALLRLVYLRVRDLPRLRTRALMTVASFGVAAALCPVLVGPGYANFLSESDDLMAFRSRAYADMGAWVNEHTPADALILAPRVYSAELTFERNVTWVTFYGNAWVVDAISTPDPRVAHRILAAHGVDYVLIADPPGTYVDRVPARGMRSYLQFGAPETGYFSFEYSTTDDHPLTTNGRETRHGLRLYRVKPAGPP